MLENLKNLFRKVRDYDKVVEENIILRNSLSQQEEKLHLIVNEKEYSILKSITMANIFANGVVTALENMNDCDVKLEIIKSLDDAFFLEKNIFINPETPNPEVERILKSTVERISQSTIEKSA